MTSSTTHGKLHRYTVQFPSTQEAENFHNGIDYVYAKYPVKLSEVKHLFDGRTVIVYAFARDWTKQRMVGRARIYGGKVVGYGTVLSKENPSIPALTPAQSQRRIADLRRAGCRVKKIETPQGTVVAKRCPPGVVMENPVPPAARGIIAVAGFIGLAFGAAWIVKKVTEEPPKPSEEPGILVDPRRGPETFQV